MTLPEDFPRPSLLEDDGLFPVAATGHRRLGNPPYDPTNPTATRIKELFCGELNRFGSESTDEVIGISGMALGADQLFAESCIECGIRWIAYVPCLRQYSRWPVAAINRYRELADAATQVWLPSGHRTYHDGCMQRRNEAMVRDCRQVLAVWDGSSGGTANCVWSATVDDIRPVRRVNPLELNAGFVDYHLPRSVTDTIGVPTNVKARSSDEFLPPSRRRMWHATKSR
jgi:uncharacterized phage-like protein YoqJ